MRVATYTRISTDETNQPYSLGAQAERLGAYIASQDGWEHVVSFTDQASGAKADRPGLQRVLAEAKLGRFDVLLVYRVDRPCRSVGLLADVLGKLDAAGVGFRSATEPFETTTPAGRMMTQLLGVFGEFERASIIERVVAGMERKASQGKWVGGRHPFGYRVEEHCLVPEPSEGPVVAAIFDRYVNELCGSHEIARWLSENGHRTRSGRPFSYKVVLAILRNRLYAGQIGWRGEWFPGEHDAIVDPETFARAQALLNERGADPAKRATHASDYLLTGLVVCSCGARLTGTTATGRHRTYRYYTCGSRQRYGKSTCDAARLPADLLDDTIVDELLAVLDDTSLIAAAVERARERAGDAAHLLAAELEGIDSELTKLDQALDRYLQSFENGTLPEEVCGTRVRSIGEQSKLLRIRRSALLEQRAESDITAPASAELAALRRTLKEVTESGPRPQVKALLHNLVQEVRVEGPGLVRPVYRVPLDGIENTLREDRGAVRAPSHLVRCSRLGLTRSFAR